jgi:hypothetical protein
LGGSYKSRLRFRTTFITTYNPNDTQQTLWAPTPSSRTLSRSARAPRPSSAPARYGHMLTHCYSPPTPKRLTNRSWMGPAGPDRHSLLHPLTLPTHIHPYTGALPPRPGGGGAGEAGLPVPPGGLGARLRERVRARGLPRNAGGGPPHGRAGADGLMDWGRVWVCMFVGGGDSFGRSDPSCCLEPNATMGDPTRR